MASLVVTTGYCSYGKRIAMYSRIIQAAQVQNRPQVKHQPPHYKTGLSNLIINLRCLLCNYTKNCNFITNLYNLYVIYCSFHTNCSF